MALYTSDLGKLAMTWEHLKCLRVGITRSSTRSSISNSQKQSVTALCTYVLNFIIVERIEFRSGCNWKVWGNEIENRTGTVICYIRKYCDAVHTRWFLRDKRGHCQRGYENVHWLSCFTHACENQAAATASVKKGNAAGFWRHTFREGRQRPSFHDEDIMWKFGQLFGAMRKCLMPWCRRRRFMLPIKTNVRGHLP